MYTSPFADRLFVKASTFQGDYLSSLRANARAFWASEVTFPEFVGMMNRTITVGLTRAWHDGASVCGITSTELNSEEFARLQSHINGEMGRVIGLAQLIEKNSKANRGKLATVFNRIDMWAGSYMMVREQAMTMACADRKLKWVWNPLKEHCGSCRTLNGRVYRASTWRRWDIYPRMWRLRCRGKYCGCEFVLTDEPVTRGRPPNI